MDHLPKVIQDESQENSERVLSSAVKNYFPRYPSPFYKREATIAEMIKSQRGQNATKESGDISVELAEKSQEIERLKKQCDQLSISLERERDAHQKSMQDTQAELKCARQELDDARQELDRLRLLTGHADLSKTEQDEGTWPYVSLCKVEGLNRYHNGLIMRRLADIVDGIIQAELDPEYPQNRTLYDDFEKNKNSGYIGVWGWKTEENLKSGKKDYVRSQWYECPVEIVVLQGCSVSSDIAQQLLKGIPFLPSGNKTLFACPVEMGRYIGLLCREDDIDISAGNIMLKSSTFNLPLYEFSEEEIIRISSYRFFYKISAGVPKEWFHVRDPLEVVRQKILARSKETALRIYGFGGKQERRKIRDFLEKFPVADFYQDIAQTCACSDAKAQEYVNEFIEKSGTYLRQEDLDEKTLAAVIDSNPDLLEKCKALLEEEWRRNYSEQIMESQAQIDKINEEIRKKQKLCQTLEAQREQYLAEKADFDAEIASRRQLSEDIEKESAARMDAVRKNTAEFAAMMMNELPFLRPELFNAVTVPASTLRPNHSAQLTAFSSGTVIDPQLLQEEKDWQGFFSILKKELEKAGVVRGLCPGFAAYLYAASLNRLPLLLAGPNAYAIANVFSCARCGRTAAVLDCSFSFSPETLNNLYYCDDEVIVLRGPLNSGWVSHLPELVSIPEKTVFAVQPFAEDLLMEPRGLYQYFLPVLTELIVKELPSGKTAGGFRRDTFKDYEPSVPRFPNEGSAVERFSGLVGLAQTRLQKVLADFRHIIGREHQKSTDYLFALFPCAYVTGKADVLLNYPNLNLPDETLNTLRAYLGDTQ